VPIGRGLLSSFAIAAPNALLFSLSLGDWLEHHDDGLLTPYGTKIHADDQALDRGGIAVARTDFENIHQKNLRRSINRTRRLSCGTAGSVKETQR
jgi:hypothetical protein